MFELSSEQARRYLWLLIDREQLVEGNTRLEETSDDDVARLARQVFLYGELETDPFEVRH